MGRLAVILGCNALGPGGEEIAAAAAEHGAAIVQRHGAADALRPPPRDRPRRQPAAAGRAGLRPGAGDRLGRLACAPSCRSAASSAPTTSSPSTSASRSSTTPAPTPRRASTARWRGEVIAAWEAGGQAPRDGGVYWQTIGPRFETPAEIRMMAPHADLVGMTIASECVDRRRARARVRGDLRRRQPRQRARRGRAQRRRDGGRPRSSTRRRLRDGLAAVLPRLGAVGPVSADRRPTRVLDGETGRRCAATGRDDRGARPRGRRRARRRDARRRRRRSWSRRWSTATPTRR